MKLPPLPEQTVPYTERQIEELRALQLATAMAVREECAKVCDEWARTHHVYLHGASKCAETVRELEFAL